MEVKYLETAQEGPKQESQRGPQLFGYIKSLEYGQSNDNLLQIHAHSCSQSGSKNFSSLSSHSLCRNPYRIWRSWEHFVRVQYAFGIQKVFEPSHELHLQFATFLSQENTKPNFMYFLGPCTKFLQISQEKVKGSCRNQEWSTHVPNLFDCSISVYTVLEEFFLKQENDLQ